MPPLDLEPDLELNSEVNKICKHLVRRLRNRNNTQYIENNPSAYHEVLAAAQEVLAAVQEIPQPKPLPTPASTPLSSQGTPQKGDSGPDSGADEHETDVVDPGDRGLPAVHEHKKLCVDSHDQISTTVHDEYENLFVDPHADDFEAEQTNDDSQRSADLDVWPPSDHNDDIYGQDEPLSQQTVTSSTPHQLDTTQNTSSKRKQHFEDGRSSKRAHIKLADAADGHLWSRSARYLTTWTYEEFALQYYMLVPSSSRTSEIRDLASKIFTKVLGASKSEGLDKYQLGLTEIVFGADILAILENLRTACLNHYAIVIQKTLKAKSYRRKYLEARNAILLIQSDSRGYLARKHIQEKCKSKAATTIQRVWRGQNLRKSFNAVRNNVIAIQAAAKGFLRRRATRVRKAAVLIQKWWRWRRYIKGWRRYRRKVVIIQSLWRGKCARRRCEKIRQEMASSDAVGQGDHGNDRMAKLPADWQTHLQRIKSTEALKDCQHFCYTIRHPVTSIDVRPDQDALKQSGGPDKIPTRDRRLRQLKFALEDGWEKEKSFETPKIVLKVSRRLHLAELASTYEAEKAMPQKRGQPSAREKFVNILFPDTIKDKSEKANERKKGEKANKGKKGEKGGKRKKGEKANKKKKGKKVSNQKGEQLSEQEVRRIKAESTFDYWIRLAKPLRRMSQRFGPPILVVLPQDVTETSLYALRKDQDQDVVDYIELHHPGIKEQISNLSSLLPGIDANKLPSKRLVIETIPHHELSDHPFEELFQFSNDRESSKLDDLPSEAQMPMETVDARQADAVVDPSLDQMSTNQPSFCGQDGIESAQSTLGDCAPEGLGGSSPGIDNGTPREFTLDIDNDRHPPSLQSRSMIPPRIAIEARNKMIHDRRHCSPAPDGGTPSWTDALVGPSFDQGCANEQLFYAQGTMKSIQSIRPDCTSESLQWQSPSAGIEDGNPSNLAADCSEYIHPSAYHDHHQEPNQQPRRYIESSFQDVDLSAQPQPSHNWGDLNPQDYYNQDDWRARQPSEGEFPDFQDSDSQQSDPSKGEFSDLDSLINYSPLNTPSLTSTSSRSRDQNLLAQLVDTPRASTPLQFPSASTLYSTLVTEPDIKPTALVDAWRDEGMPNCTMTWTAYDQGAGTVCPKDLFQASV